MGSRTLSLVADAFWALLLLAILGVAGLTLAGFFARLWWLFELASHFRVQYFLILAGCALVFLAGRRTEAAALAGGVALVNLALILPAYLGQPRTPSQPAHYRAVLINVLQPNRSYEGVRSFLRETAPDFVVLIEVNQRWLDELEPLSDELPYRLAQPRRDHYGVAFLSRIPLLEPSVLPTGPQARPTLLAHLDLEGTRLAVIGTHPPPPKQRSGSHARNGHISELAGLVRSQAGPVMVLGDLNLSPWSPYFGDLLSSAGLQDSREGFGIQASWPTAVPLLRVPIDHVLHSPEVAIHHRWLGPDVGSDHFPVVVEFSVPVAAGRLPTSSPAAAAELPAP